jgi:TonB family protein
MRTRLLALVVAPILWAAEPPDAPARAIRTGIPFVPPCPPGAKCGELSVRLSVLISRDGKVLESVIIDGSGLDAVDSAAIDYVRTWPFAPARKGGQAVESWLTVRVTFA